MRFHQISHMKTFHIGTRYDVEKEIKNGKTFRFSQQIIIRVKLLKFISNWTYFVLQSHEGTTYEGTSLYPGGPKMWELDHYVY